MADSAPHKGILCSKFTESRFREHLLNTFTLCPSPFSLSWFSFEGRRTKSPQTHCSAQNHLTQVQPELSEHLNPLEWQQGT